MIWHKIQEISEYFWTKLAIAIPAGMLVFEDREQVMIVALLVIITVDCIFGAMVAHQRGKFEWTKLAKKFSKKFLLYFFTLFASFVLHNAFPFLEWWFYTIGSIITLSEFASLMQKGSELGLPIQGNIFEAIGEKAKKEACRIAGVKYQKSKGEEEIY